MKPNFIEKTDSAVLKSAAAVLWMVDADQHYQNPMLAYLKFTKYRKRKGISMQHHTDYLPPWQPASKTTRTSVFICSPFAGDIGDNTRKAIRYMRYAITNGFVPFAPHLLYPQVLDENDTCERELGLCLGMCWLNRCDEIWVFGSRITPGMERELIKAKRLNKPVRWFTEVCTEITE